MIDECKLHNRVVKSSTNKGCPKCIEMFKKEIPFGSKDKIELGKRYKFSKKCEHCKEIRNMIGVASRIEGNEVCLMVGNPHNYDYEYLDKKELLCQE
jgi:hypothetical protein